MACNTIRQAVVELKEETDTDTLKAALKRMGLDVADDWDGRGFSFSGYIKKDGRYISGSFRGGKLTFPNSAHKFSVAKIKQAYSKVVIEKEAARMRWQLKEEGMKYSATKPHSKDKISIEVLEDGTIKTTTDKISPANHASADQFLLNMARAAGGELTVSRRRDYGTMGATQTVKE